MPCQGYNPSEDTVDRTGGDLLAEFRRMPKPDRQAWLKGLTPDERMALLGAALNFLLIRPLEARV